MGTDATFILMPGLHGTDDLFSGFASVIPAARSKRILSYPPTEPLSYDALLEWTEIQLQAEQRMVLIAESFAGPLAIRFAAAHSSRVQAVILVASFVKPPVPRWLRHLARPFIFRGSPPAIVVRLLMLGRACPSSAVEHLRAVMGTVQPRVIATRLREVLDLDCTAALKNCRVPILYLQAEHDRVVRNRSLRLILRIRPDVQFRRLPGPHLLLQVNPRAAWRSIDGFLKSSLR